MMEISENDQPTESDLQELLKFIQGKAFPLLGPGIRTYTDDDPRCRRLHGGCLELERQGKIVRYRDEGDMVIWMPKEMGEWDDTLKGYAGTATYEDGWITFRIEGTKWKK